MLCSDFLTLRPDFINITERRFLFDFPNTIDNEHP